MQHKRRLLALRGGVLIKVYVGRRFNLTLYKNGRAEEANKLLAQLLEEKIERHRKNAEQQ